MKIEITEQQLFDYISCPAKYDMRYNKKIILNDFSFNKILEDVTRYFFIYLINKLKVPSLRMLTDRLDSLTKNYQDILDNKQYLDGVFKIQNFYNWACSEQLAVFNVGSEYLLSQDNIILKGLMKPLAINKRKQVEFLDLNFSQRNANQDECDAKLKYSIDMYSYNNFKKNNEQAIGVKIHTVKTNKDIYTTRFDNDYTRMLTTINNVGKGIINNIYYPRESHMCSSCIYKNYCRAWK